MPFSVTVNWLTANQSLLRWSLKSTTETMSPRTEPSAVRYSVVHQFENLK